MGVYDKMTALRDKQKFLERAKEEVVIEFKKNKEVSSIFRKQPRFTWEVHFDNRSELNYLLRNSLEISVLIDQFNIDFHLAIDNALLHAKTEYDELDKLDKGK